MIGINKNNSESERLQVFLEMTGTGLYEIDINSFSGPVYGIIEPLVSSGNDRLPFNEFVKIIPDPFFEKIKDKLINSIKNLKPLDINYPLEIGGVLKFFRVKGKLLNNSTYILSHQLISPAPIDSEVEIDNNLQLVLNFLPLPLMIFSDDGKIEFINNTFTEITGYHHDDIPTIDAWVKNAYEEKSSTVLEVIKQLYHVENRLDEGKFEIQTKDNGPRIFHFFSAPLGKNKKGRKQILSVAADVTESTKKDRLIDQQNEELTILNEKLPYLLIAANAQGQITYANQNAISYTGSTFEEIRANWIDLIHPEDRAIVEERRLKSLKTGNTFNVDCRIKHYGNGYRWFNFKIIPIKNDEGVIIKWLGAGIDIHEQYVSQQQLTERLKNEVSHLYEIIESLPQIAWTADLEGNIYYYNKRYYEFTQQNPDEALGWGWKKVKHPEDVENSIINIESAIKEGKEFEMEGRFLNGEDKKYYWHLIKVLPVKNSAGEVKYWIGTATNIHEQKMLEYNKGEFLNVASHELRTPLTSLTGYLQLMEDAIQRNDNGSLGFYVQRSLNSTYNITRLINDLLNLSNIESGKIADFQKEKIDFKSFINDIIENYQQLYPDRKFIFNSRNGKYKAYGNAFRLEQVFDNLITNAIKYAPDSPIEISLKKEEKNLVVEISDEGKGIPKNKLSAVFDRFYRIKDSSGSSGLGVGLFISKEIIEQHNGKIWAENNPLEGTTFKFVIPGN